MRSWEADRSRLNPKIHDYKTNITTNIQTTYNMEILQEDNGKKGKFFILEKDVQEAEMTYTWAGPHRIIIDHTEVNEALKGKGAGKQMVMKAVAFARDRQIKVLPLCPFAKSVFDKMPEIRDVL